MRPPTCRGASKHTVHSRNSEPVYSFVHSNKQRSSCMPCALNPQNDPNRSHVRKNSHQRTTMFGKRTNSGSYPENQSRSGSRHVCPQGLTSASLCMHQGQCWTARHASVLGGAAGAHPPRGQFPLAVWRAQRCRLVGCSTAHIYHSEAWYRVWQARCTKSTRDKLPLTQTQN